MPLLSFGTYVGGYVPDVGHSGGIEAGRVPHGFALGPGELVEHLRAALRALLLRDRLLGSALGFACAVSVGVLLWQSIWFDAVDWRVAVAASGAVAVALLTLPLRDTAGVFALTLSVLLAGVATAYFVTPWGPAPGVGASAVGAPIAASMDDAEGSSASGTESLEEEVVPAPLTPATSTFGHTVANSPGASDARREPVTPCQSRLRAWRWAQAHGTLESDGPCELKGTHSRR